MTDLIQQAIDAHRANNLTDAEALYLQALQAEPDRADARYNLGIVYGQQSRLNEALREFIHATKIKPNFGEAWLMASECAGSLGRVDVSVETSKQAVDFMPTNAQAWLRHGLALNALEKFEEAIAAYRRTIELEPTLINARINLALNLKNIGRPEESETVILAAIKATGATLNTDDEAEHAYNILHWHLALLKLTLDQYSEGFAYFRARFKGGTNWNRLDTPQPLWRGEPLQNKVILISAEQGHGDMLMMARYLPLLKAQGAKVIFQTHPALQGYFKGWDGADEVVSTEAPLTMPFDYHAPVFDLPYRFQTTFETIPAQTPYLPIPVSDDKTNPLSEGQRKVGVIWSGEPKNARDKMRSVPLNIFADIFAAKNITFYSLNHNLRSEDVGVLEKYNVTNLQPHIHSFKDTARLISQMDLVITCDTAAAHLAGGMGKQVWVLLPFVPDWRWGYQRENTPWYPTARLFRQKEAGDWADVIKNVLGTLTEKI